jgi:hypothetical protein
MMGISKGRMNILTLIIASRDKYIKFLLVFATIFK